MNRKRLILKRIMSVLLALVTVLVTAGSNSSILNTIDTAFAANMEIGTHVFQSPGIDVFGDGRQTTMTVKFADGKNAYCVEYGTDIKDLSTYKPTDTPDVVLGPQQKTQIAYALAYGYSPSSPVITSSMDRAKYAVTQGIIWCITEKHWGDSAVMNKVRDTIAPAINSVYPDVSIQYTQNYFNELRSAMTLAMDRTTPCDLAVNARDASTITLHWNSRNSRYQETLTDANGVLSAFDFSSLSASGINYTISGNSIIFYTSAAGAGMTTPVLTVNPKDGSYAAKHCSTSVIYWDNGTDDQVVVSLDNLIPDPIRAYVKFNTETSTLRIKKVSSDNGEPLNNVTFDIYSDAACTSLVKSAVTQTIDGESGIADITGLNTGQTYYVKERAGAQGTNHRLLADAVAVTVSSGTNTIEIKNDRVPVTVTLTKKDDVTGEGVSGAVYSLYAREDIKAAAGDKVLYTAGSWVADFPETDENGKSVLDSLYIGKYFIKEKSAPASGIYELDPTEYEVDASASSKNFEPDAVISVNVDVTEKHSPGYLRIEKTSSRTGAALEGAVFGIYSDAECKNLIQTITTGEDGSAISQALNEGIYYVKEIEAPEGYATSTKVYSESIAPAKTSTVKAENDPVTIAVSKTSVTGDCPEIPGAELVIKDAAGNEIERWVSVGKPHVVEALPPGLYSLTELRTPFGYQAAETVDFTVLDTGRIQTVKMVDAETYGKIIINKTDEKTGKPLKNVTFEVHVSEDVPAADGSTVIAAGTVMDTLITDENGHAESIKLPIGTYGAEGFTSYIKYELQETGTIAGYVKDDTVHEILFDYVDDKTPVIEKTFDITNDFTKVEISKTSVTGDCPEIPDAELVVKDAADNEIERWISTTEPHMIERLQAGDYTLTELRTPFGYQAAETVSFTVEETGEIQTVEMVDAETYGKIVINKTDAGTGKPLKGITFEVRVSEDVPDADGNVAIKAGTVVDTLVTDENGHAGSIGLPIGTYGTEGFTSYIKYELQETGTIAGYVKDDTVYEIRFDYVDDKTPVIEKIFDITNDFTKVEISKTSVTGECPEIPGAELVVKDADGNEVERWISTTEPHMIERLPAGDYTLTELRTPFGYQAAETVNFTVEEETGEIQAVEMVDAETYGKVVINKTDAGTGEPLKGVTFEMRVSENVLDADGNVAIKAGTVVDTLVTDGNGHAESIGLPIGTYGEEGFTSYIKYELQETKTIAGYVKDDTVYEIRFDYVDDKTPVIEKTFNIKNNPVEVPPQTGDGMPWYLFMGLLIISTLIVSIILFIRKRTGSESSGH